MTLSSRFSDALLYANHLHADQTRKGSGVPYISHLLAVCALVMEHGGDEDQAIAALLHDAAEDQGGYDTLSDIRARFGDRVARMVGELSDTFDIPKPPWRTRKETYLAHLPHAPADTLLVSLADKVHNARTILADHALIGEAIWGRFTQGREGTLWYYRALADLFQRLHRGYLADELSRVVTALEQASR
ncbi:MAG: HD domain-containing protein [Anaerolineales bacterium]|nr:HD domain-containing protein [Anaerolineales bacterium]